MASSGSGLKTIVFLGSVREGRMGLRVAKFVMKQLEAANHVVELFGKKHFLDYWLFCTSSCSALKFLFWTVTHHSVRKV